MLIKLKSTKGADIYVNTDQIAVLSPHGTLINISNIMFPTGLAIEVEGTVEEVRWTLAEKSSEDQLGDRKVVH